MKTILIAGGTGLVGHSLIKILKEQGYNIHLLSRKKHSHIHSSIWDPEKGTIDLDSIPVIDAIINLSGASIGDGRWTKRRKAAIVNSRVGSNKLIQQIFDNQSKHVECYISASAIGIYGDRGENEVDEDAAISNKRFLAKTVKAWEHAVNKVHQNNLRTVIFRFGMVLSKDGGVLDKLIQPTKFFIAPYFGNGKQYYSWIHVQDLCQMILLALENKKMKGTYNAVSPEPVTNKSMMKSILKAKRVKGLLIPVPVFLLKIFLGEMSDLLLLSTRVVPKKIKETNFIFKYPQIDKALKNLLT